MDETPLTKRPWFYIFAWLAILLIVYGWQIFRMGGIQAGLRDIFVDVIVFFLLLYGWMAFFAQFVLPVEKFSDRQKIFSRLLTRLSGGHGPALFIENGVIKEHSGETPSARPWRRLVGFCQRCRSADGRNHKKNIGPGVIFLNL